MTDLMQGIDLDSGSLEDFNKAMSDGSGIQLPFASINIWATSGKKALKQAGGVAYFGGWSIDADKAEEMELDANMLHWGKVERSGEGGDYTVYETRVITIAPIAIRESWLSKDGKSRAPKYDEQHTRSHTQILALLGTLVQEADKRRIAYVCPTVVSTKGIGMGRSMKNAMADWRKVIDPLRKELNAIKLPPVAWWITLGTRGDEAVFEEVGSTVKNTVTPIKAILPAEKVTASILTARFIGKDNFAIAHDLLGQARDWLNAWKSQVVDAEPTMPEPAGNTEEILY